MLRAGHTHHPDTAAAAAAAAAPPVTMAILPTRRWARPPTTGTLCSDRHSSATSAAWGALLLLWSINALRLPFLQPPQGLLRFSSAVMISKACRGPLDRIDKGSEM